MKKRISRPKQKYFVYVENKSLEIDSSFMNQIRQLMKLSNVNKNLRKKFNPNCFPIRLSGDDCLDIFYYLEKLKNVRKNSNLFDRFVTLLAQAYTLDVKGMTIIRNK